MRQHSHSNWTEDLAVIMQKQFVSDMLHILHSGGYKDSNTKLTNR